MRNMNDIYPELITLDADEEKDIRKQLSKMGSDIHIDANSRAPETTPAYMLNYLKLAYNLTEHQIDKNEIEKLLEYLEKNDRSIIQYHAIKAHLYNHSYRNAEKKDETLLWLSFCHLNYVKLKKEQNNAHNEMFDDIITKGLYRYLHTWYMENCRINRAKFPQFELINHSLFYKSTYGTLTINNSNTTLQGLHRLPKDVLLLIMALLPPKAISALSKVDKRFFVLAHDHQLWEKLETSLIMSDADYIKHCESHPTFYKDTARRRIRDYFAKSLPYYEAQLVIGNNDHPVGYTLNKGWWPVLYLIMLAGLAFGIWSGYHNRDQFSLFGCIMASLFYSVLFVGAAGFFGAIGLGLFYGLAWMMNVITVSVIKSYKDPEIYNRNAKNEPFRIQSINNSESTESDSAESDIEAALGSDKSEASVAPILVQI